MTSWTLPVAAMALMLPPLSACTPEMITEGSFDCPALPADALAEHPRDVAYQQSLDSATAAGLPGAILLVRDENGLWLGASGYADIASQVDMRPCHRMLVASNTKSLVGTVVVGLAEEGLLHLDDPMADHLDPDISARYEYADRITVRQLLNHTSGLVNYTRMLPWLTRLFNDPGYTWTADELLALTFDTDLYFEPGEGWEYSNTNYLLLGEIVGTVTGRSVDDALNQRILEPLDLNGSSYHTDHFDEGFVRGYFDFYGNGTLFDVTDTLSRDGMAADGGMISTAADLSIYLEALMRDKTLISEDSLDEMLDAVPRPDGPLPYATKQHYGLGLNRFETPYGDAWGHGGGKVGFVTDMFYFPERDTTVVFLTNSSGDPTGVYDQQLARIFDVIFGAPLAP